MSNERIKETIIEARKNIEIFYDLIEKHGDRYTPMIKYTLEEENNRVHMWLMVVEVKSDNFIARLFEVPIDFKSFSLYDVFEIHKNEILDWMINLDGDVYGGYSLRYQRELLSEDEKESFDEHIGINKFC